MLKIFVWMFSWNQEISSKEGNEYLSGLADQWKEILKELKKRMN